MNAPAPPPSFADTSAKRLNEVIHVLALAGVHNTNGDAEQARKCLAEANRQLSTLRVAFDQALGPKHLKRGR